MKKLDAADRLANAEPIDKRQGDVSRLLEPLLDPKEMNEALRRSAVRAWGRGATPEASILLERMGPDEKDILVKALAVAAIGQLKDGKAAEPVANALADLLLLITPLSRCGRWDRPQRRPSSRCSAPPTLPCAPRPVSCSLKSAPRPASRPWKTSPRTRIPASPPLPTRRYKALSGKS